MSKNSLPNSGDHGHDPRELRERLVRVIERLRRTEGVKTACKALAVPRAFFFRDRPDLPERYGKRRRKDQPLNNLPRALTPEKRKRALEPLHSKRFEHVALAHNILNAFFDCHNSHLRHSGIGFLTPYTVHHGLADQVLAHRPLVRDAAHQTHPERFVRRSPPLVQVPKAMYINPPQSPGDKAQEPGKTH